MSLLNDALKAAEQRQDKPAPSPYIGHSTSAPAQRSNAGKVVAVIGVTAILGAGAYFYLSPATPPATPVASQQEDSQARETAVDAEVANTSTEAATVDVPSSSSLTARKSVDEPEAVEVSETDIDQGPADIVMLSSQEVQPEPTEVLPPVTPEPEQPSAVEATAAPEVAEPAPVQRGPQPPAQTTKTAKTTTTAPAESEARTTSSSDQASEEPAAQQPTAASDIKHTRQTPAQQDLAASKDIRKLVSSGDLAAAEAALTELADTQTAPQSRYVFARGVLARGNVDRALAWVPEDLAARHPDLRLIRARAILAGGDLDQAVATLRSGVPPVKDNVEYRVTLATLLQQQGQSDQAANHWAELIAWDNGQAPWWVGLAIALEGRGDVPGARRAYQQAAALPGLAPSLADYVRQRLQTLGAG
ncbi:tetratricopeptide repeat protein [Marinobacter lacisalsi]|uniref:Tetratricopeptide repeat protein n=1 Tax=Marinobacter lacisalsi TaxID=475979 RepID=A0ABV8QG40_9GAMM